MAIQLIILQACALAGAEVSEHADVGDKPSVDSKEEALALCRMGRALFLDKANDPTKGQYTASEADLKRIKAQAQAIAQERERRVAPQGSLQDVIDAAVAKALQAAGAAKAPA